MSKFHNDGKRSVEVGGGERRSIDLLLFVIYIWIRSNSGRIRYILIFGRNWLRSHHIHHLQQ